MWRRVSSYPVPLEGQMAIELAKQRFALNTARLTYIKTLSDLDTTRKAIMQLTNELKMLSSTPWTTVALRIAKLRAYCHQLRILRNHELTSQEQGLKIHEAHERLEKDLELVLQQVQARVSIQTHLESSLSRSITAFQRFDDAGVEHNEQPPQAKTGATTAEIVEAAVASCIAHHTAEIRSREMTRTLRLLGRKQDDYQYYVDMPLLVEPVSSTSHRTGAVLDSLTEELIAQSQKHAESATQAMARMCIAAIEAIDQRFVCCVCLSWPFTDA